MRNFNRFFRSAALEMKAKGTYFRGNQGNWVLNGAQAFGVPSQLGLPRTNKDINEKTEQIFNKAREGVLKLLANEDPTPFRRGSDAIVPLGIVEKPATLESFMGDTDLRTLQPVAAAE